jgi:hypothetical protein
VARLLALLVLLLAALLEFLQRQERRTFDAPVGIRVGKSP